MTGNEKPRLDVEPKPRSEPEIGLGLGLWLGNGSGSGGGAPPASTAGQPIGLLFLLTKDS